MVREFALINEKGRTFSLMNIENYVLLTDPAGLGYRYNTQYEQVGTAFLENVRRIEQGQIVGIVNTTKYENFKKLIDFIEGSESIRFLYRVPYQTGAKEYYKDVKINELTKTQKNTNGIISETITFDCLGLWYSEDETVYDVTSGGDEMRWDYRWDARYTEYDVRSLAYNNQGHIPAPILVEIDGEVSNPKIEIIRDGETVASIEIPITIGVYEKLLYSSKTGEIFIKKQLADGTETSLFKKQYIDITKNNIFKLPLGVSEVKLSADDEINSAKLTIYPQYKAV